VTTSITMLVSRVQGGQVRCWNSIPSTGKRLVPIQTNIWWLLRAYFTGLSTQPLTPKQWRLCYTPTPSHTFMACTRTTLPSHIPQHNSPHSPTAGSTIQNTVSVSTAQYLNYKQVRILISGIWQSITLQHPSRL